MADGRCGRDGTPGVAKTILPDGFQFNRLLFRRVCASPEVIAAAPVSGQTDTDGDGLPLTNRGADGSVSNGVRMCIYPLTTAIGRNRATFWDIPAPCTTSTTSVMSL